MYSIGDYVGQKVRRISFIVKRADDGQYHHLLSLECQRDRSVASASASA